MHRGFTLIESVVSIAIFAILAAIVFQISVSIVKQTRSYRENTTISGLADKYMEIARNLSYSQVGTLSGNPNGALPDLPNATSTSWNGNSYKIYYVVTYVNDPGDPKNEPDYKQVKLYVTNMSTGVASSFVTNIAPATLQTPRNTGTLEIKVFNAVGQPVPNATINITDASVTPHINLTRLSDANGNWTEVALPDSFNSYHVVVTKNGYSTDQTYPITGGDPNPVKADSTVANSPPTQVSFSIDQLSSLIFNTVNQMCSPLSGVGVEVQGAKLIGTPNVLKFDRTYASDSSGHITLNNLEWDNYTPILTGNSYMVYGSSPIQEISILPNTSQAFTLVLGPQTANSLLVIVKDASTGNPIQGANVDLQSMGPASDTNEITGGSIWSQADWTGGSGQNNFSNPSMYSTDDGNVSTTNIPTGIRLNSANGLVTSMSGSLTSSTFDTGASTTAYTTLNWQPTSQDPAETVEFQIAANNDNQTWNFVGPDGTASTYYTVPGTTINAGANGNEFIRYKVFLSTTDAAKNPVVTSVSLNYVSGCFTPGQVMFPGLAQANYNIIVSDAGYQTQTISNANVSGYETLSVSLAH